MCSECACLILFPQCERKPALSRGRETVWGREKAAVPLTGNSWETDCSQDRNTDVCPLNHATFCLPAYSHTVRFSGNTWHWLHLWSLMKPFLHCVMFLWRFLHDMSTNVEQVWLTVKGKGSRSTSEKTLPFSWTFVWSLFLFELFNLLSDCYSWFCVLQCFAVWMCSVVYFSVKTALLM